MALLAQIGPNLPQLSFISPFNILQLIYPDWSELALFNMSTYLHCPPSPLSPPLCPLPKCQPYLPYLGSHRVQVHLDNHVHKEHYVHHGYHVHPKVSTRVQNQLEVSEQVS